MKEIWEKQLMTGVSEIDVEHLTLIETVDQLYEALRAGKGKEEVEGTLNFLQNYVKIHFKHEEALQESYEYPEFKSHQKMHKDFVDSVERLRTMIENENTTTNAMEVTHFCMEWLKQHIGVEDRKLATFILKKRS